VALLYILFFKTITANLYREEAGCGHEARALRALKEGVRLAPTQHLVWLSLGAVACQLTDWPLAQHAFIRYKTTLKQSIKLSVNLSSVVKKISYSGTLLHCNWGLYQDGNHKEYKSIG
jgi:hypothetical protein